MVHKEVLHFSLFPMSPVGLHERNPLQGNPAPVESNKENDGAVHEDVGRIVDRGSLRFNPKTDENREDVVECQGQASGRVAHANQCAEEQHLASHTGQLHQNGASLEQTNQDNAMNDVGLVTVVDNDPSGSGAHVMLEVGCVPDVRRVHDKVTAGQIATRVTQDTEGTLVQHKVVEHTLHGEGSVQQQQQNGVPARHGDDRMDNA